MRSNTYTLVFTSLVTIVLGFLVSMAATALSERQELNVKIDQRKNILRSLGFRETEDTPWTIEKVQELFNDYITGIVVDREGNVIPGKRPEDITPEEEQSLLPIYVKKTNGKVDGYAFPISGKGLWSTLYGYLALEPDGKTVKGITFYKHGETPGLGGEVEKTWFTSNFIGKHIVDPQGNLVSIQVIKGKVDPTSPEAYHQVDGISGASMTGKGLTLFLAEDLRTYDPFFQKIRQGVAINGITQ